MLPPTHPRRREFYSHWLVARVISQWIDWQRGIPPGREWAGRGAQNPWLLRVFDLLTDAERRATASRSGGNG